MVRLTGEAGGRLKEDEGESVSKREIRRSEEGVEKERRKGKMGEWRLRIWNVAGLKTRIGIFGRG